MFPVVGSEQVYLLVAAVWGTEAEQLMGRVCEYEAVTLCRPSGNTFLERSVRVCFT